MRERDLGRKLIRSSGPVQHAIELRERSAHLRFDPFDGQTCPLSNFRVSHSVDPVRHEYLPRLWTQAHDSGFKPPEHISGFKQTVLIRSLQHLFVRNDMQGGTMSDVRLCAILQEIVRDPAKIGLRSLERRRPPPTHPCEAEEDILDEVLSISAVRRPPRQDAHQFRGFASIEFRKKSFVVAPRRAIFGRKRIAFQDGTGSHGAGHCRAANR